MSPAADLVVYARIVHGPDGPLASATSVALRDGRILAVGDAKACRAHVGPRTEVARVPNGTILPGLVDAHGHLAGYGLGLETLDLRGTTSPADVAARVSQAARESPRGEWIVGRGWDQNDWTDAAFPDRETLDAAAPGRSVYLRRIDGHAAWVSTPALRAASVDRSTPAPEGGRISFARTANRPACWSTTRWTWCSRCCRGRTTRRSVAGCSPPPTSSRPWG